MERYENKHKVRVVKAHTGHPVRGSCFERDGVVGLWFNTYKGLRHDGNRDTIGRLHQTAHERWVPIRCNTPGCEFEGLVNVRWLEDLAIEAFEET